MREDINTHWSKPTRNIFKAIGQLRAAIKHQKHAKLIRLWNHECWHPIKEKKPDTDFRNYEFQIGYAASRDSIRDRADLT